MSTTTITTRAEHLAWCKQRALAYCDTNDPDQAFASMLSDMRKHPETENHAALRLMAQLRFAGHLSNNAEMRKFIEGFN